MQTSLRCYAISEGRQPILRVRPDGDTEETGETEVTSLTVSLWDASIPEDVHTDRKVCVTLTVMDRSLFPLFARGKVYTVSIE